MEGVALSDDTCMEADLVVVAAGIRPNIELALKGGIAANRGILVNDYMETSHPDIYAVGECVEHRGVCYGLVAPLYERGRCSRRDDYRQSRPGLRRHRTGGEAQDHGRRRVLRRRLERAERGAGPVRGSRTPASTRS